MTLGKKRFVHMRPNGGVGRCWCGGQWGGGATVAMMVSVMRAVNPHCPLLYTVMDAEHAAVPPSPQHHNTYSSYTLAYCKLIHRYQLFCKVLYVLHQSKTLTKRKCGEAHILVSELVLEWCWFGGGGRKQPKIRKFWLFG